MLAVAGVDHVITMDLHSSQIQGFFKCPVDNLFAEPSIAKYIREHVPGWEDGVVVSKNAGAVKRVTSMADRLKVDFALIHRDSIHGNGARSGSGTGGTADGHQRGNTNGSVLHKASGSQKKGKHVTIAANRGTSAALSASSSMDSFVTQLSHMDVSLNGSHYRQRTWSIHHQDPEEDDEDDRDSTDGLTGTRDPTVPSTHASSPQNSHARSQSPHPNPPNPNGDPNTAPSHPPPTRTDLVLVGDVRNRVAFVLDDILDSPRSFLDSARFLVHQCHARQVFLVATHGILSHSALCEIEQCAEVTGVIVTNTYPLERQQVEQAEQVARQQGREKCKLEVIDVSAVLAEAIRRTHNGESISYLFDTTV